MKGQWRTIESVMAGIIILMFVAVLTSTGIQVSSSATVQGYRALDAVYEKGVLRAYAAAMDISSINSEIAATGYMFGYNHSVTICNESACTGAVPDSENVWASSLLLAGDGQYEPMEVIIYVFRD